GGENDPQDAPLELLSADDVVELRRRGFEIGSHGNTHTDLGRFSGAIVEAELRVSAARLAEILGEPPRFLAWPYGSSSAQGEAAAAAVGFEAAFSTDMPTTSRYAISRVPIYRLDGRVLLALKTSGRYTRLRRSVVVDSTYSAV